MNPTVDVSSILKCQLENKSIVFTNGCFDLLHKGHIHLLEEAKKLGDILVVAINTDDSVKKLKGETRPIDNIETRINKLQKLGIVDFILTFSEETPIQLIEKIKPTILVKGSDYQPENIIGKEFAQMVITIPLLDGFSTTKIIENNLEN